MTIIGFEKRKDGGRNILVFDPMFYDSNDVIRLIGQEDVSPKKPGELLRFYRRDLRYLQKYNEFEVLRQVYECLIPALPIKINSIQVDSAKGDHDFGVASHPVSQSKRDTKHSLAL